MILKEIRIKNFRSYYGEQSFRLSEGLTLIIGDNGDGKTTFFESLEWLLNPTNLTSKVERNISEKRKAELSQGEIDDVSVALHFEHNGEKEVVKSFSFARTFSDSIEVKDIRLHGYKVEGTERIPVDGRKLLDNCFPFQLRKYCLFKGESELNVFDNETALNTLVDTFSGVRDYDEFVNLTSGFADSAEKVVIKEKKNDKKNEREVKECESQLLGLNKQIQETRLEITQKIEAVSDFQKKIRLLEENQELGENYQRISDRIKDKEKQCSQLRAHVRVDFNARLLDDNWILRSFSPILNEYRQKIHKFSKEKRILQKEEDQRIAKEQGELEMLNKIQDSVNNFVQLPWNLPDDTHMQEMIDEEVCKVCGRPAPKGSEAYNFMVKKLQDYMDHIKQETEKQQKKSEKKQLFKNHFIEELHNRSIQLGGEIQQNITQISSVIDDELNFIQSRRMDLEKVTKDLKEAEDEKLRLLVQTDGLTENDLKKMFNDYKGYSDSSKRAEISLVELNQKLKEYEEKKEEVNKRLSSIEPANNIVKTYEKIQKALTCIYKAFEASKNDNINKFILLLEEKANCYLDQLNSNDFHGDVRILRTLQDNARIALFSEDGSEVFNPSTSQKTTMYMSVLFAISEITTLSRSNDYPLIFDAPTSSFGGMKSTDFYNIINNIDKQCVIVTKDLLKINNQGTYDIDEEKIKALNCAVYQIKKAKGFIKNDLSTIQTIVESIK